MVVAVIGYFTTVVDIVITAIDSPRRDSNLFSPPHCRKEEALVSKSLAPCFPHQEGSKQLVFEVDWKRFSLIPQWQLCGGEMVEVATREGEASPTWNGDRIWGCHRCQAMGPRSTKHPGLGEAGAAWHEKEARHQTKIPLTSEKE